MNLVVFLGHAPTTFTPRPVKGRVTGMNQVLLMIVVVGLMGCCIAIEPPPGLKADQKPSTNDESGKVIEAAIREAAKKPTGKLTKADYEKVRTLALFSLQLTNVKGLEKLKHLEFLSITDNQLTKVPKNLEKLTKLETLYLNDNQLTDVKRLEKLNQLKFLNLEKNPALTKAQITNLQKALPKCIIYQPRHGFLFPSGMEVYP